MRAHPTCEECPRDAMSKRASYHPHTLTISSGHTPYEAFHEWAHVAQHARRTLAWRALQRLRLVPVLGRVALLAVEIEAAHVARAEMRACGLWQQGDAYEAARGLCTYLQALTIFRE